MSTDVYTQLVEPQELPICVSIPDGSDFLDKEALTRLTINELKRRTEALAPELAERADEAERIGRPVPAMWSALRKTGFFYQFVPKAFGGLGGTIDDFIDVALPIARSCPSTGWNACFCAGHNIHLAQFPEETQREIWGGKFPYIVAPFLGAPPGRPIQCEGGYRVSGRWEWGSGVMNADWIFAMMMFDISGTKRPALAMIPVEEVEVLDTWHVDGLKGSGSNTVLIEDVFVPTNRFVSEEGLIAGKTSGSRLHPEPIFHTPMVSRAGFFAAVSVVGAAQGAVEEMKRTWSKQTESKPVQDLGTRYARLGEAHLMVNAAECLLRETGRKMLNIPPADEDQIRLRIQTRSSFAYAVTLCRKAVQLLNAGAGSSAHRLNAPFQRFVRDLNMMTSNVGFDEDQSFELAGRSLLSLPPNTPVF